MADAKCMSVAILSFLEGHKLEKSARALRKELVKAGWYNRQEDVESAKQLASQQGSIKWEPTVDREKANASSSSSSSSSDDDSDGDSDGEPEKGKAPPRTKSTKRRSSKSSSRSDSSSDSEDEKKAPRAAKAAPATKKTSDSSSPQRSASKQPKTGPEPPAKKAKVEPAAKRKPEKVVSPDEESDVSDVEVSSVSSVDVSSSSSSSSSSDEEASSSSDDESSEEEEEEEHDEEEMARQKKEEADRRAKEAAEAAHRWKPNTQSAAASQIRVQAGTDGAQALSKGKPFQRVDSGYWTEEAAKVGGAAADNSYEGAFGTGGFGARSSEKLQKVRGKDFRHEKTKRKRSFNGFARTGGQIDTSQTFSTKFNYSDEE